MKTKLTILNGELSGDRIPLNPGDQMIIGRDQRADICLPERKISRKHAKIVVDHESDLVSIEDMGSLNGTFVNSQPITRSTILEPGDQIRIGSFLLRFDSAEGPSVQSEIPEINSARSTSHEQAAQADPGATLYESQPEFKEHSSEERQSPMEGLEAISDMSDPNQAAEAFNAISVAGGSTSTGGRLISGRLDELSLADILQMLSATQKSGHLVISKEKLLHPPEPRAPGIASLFLDNGHLKHAELGELTNEEAFFKSLTLDRAYFALFPSKYKNFDEIIETPLEALLLQGLSKIDEMRAVEEELEETDQVIARPDEPLTGLTSEELAVFQISWKHKRMGDIWAKSPYGKLQTTEIIKKLIRNRFLERHKS